MGGRYSRGIDAMIIHLNESRIRTLAQLRAVLDGIQTLDFTPADNCHTRDAWVDTVLHRFRYRQLKRLHRGDVRRYLRRFSGFSRAACWLAVASRWRSLCMPITPGQLAS
jgi:hypothetical protein